MTISKYIQEIGRLNFFLISIWTLISVGFLNNLISIVISETIYRILIQDIIFIILYIGLWQKFGANIANFSSWANSTLIIALIICSFFSFLNGFGDNGILALREFRFFIYFSLILIIFACSERSKINLIENFITQVAVFSLISTLMYIFYIEYLKTLGTYGYILRTMGEIDKAITIGWVGKVKFNSAFIVFIAARSMIQMVSAKGINWVALFILGASLYIAFVSNMRANFYGTLFGLSVTFLYITSLKTIHSQRYLSPIIGVFFFTAVLSMFNYFSDSSYMFNTQILGKEIGDITRLDVFLRVMDFSVLEYFGFFGEGLGANKTLFIGGVYFNSVDSLFLSIAYNYGYPFLALILFLVIKLILESIAFFVNNQGDVVNFTIMISLITFAATSVSDNFLKLNHDSILTGLIFGYFMLKQNVKNY